MFFLKDKILKNFNVNKKERDLLLFVYGKSPISRTKINLVKIMDLYYFGVKEYKSKEKKGIYKNLSFEKDQMQDAFYFALQILKNIKSNLPAVFLNNLK